MDLERVPIENPEQFNLILGQAHFIKTPEDLYEGLVTTVPGIRFGLAFCEASGPCLVRVEGNDAALEDLAAENALRVGAGHVFLIFLREAYPVNVLPAVRAVPEVCTVYCATANPVSVIVADDGNGRGVLGVIDGARSRGRESADDVEERRALLREIGYKH